MIVVKVGGSLFDHPRLGIGLLKWVKAQPEPDIAIVPGGGSVANVIRDYHRVHRLAEERSHWLAIGAMDLNGALLRHWTGEAASVPSMVDFCRDDEGSELALGHDWRVTSDSIAARFAESRGATKLVLLKSTNLPARLSWDDAANQGLVDQAFPSVIQRSGLWVEWVNFRRWLDETVTDSLQ